MVLLVVPVVQNAVLLRHRIRAPAILPILFVHSLIVVFVDRANCSGGMIGAVLIRSLIFLVIEPAETTA